VVAPSTAYDYSKHYDTNTKTGQVGDPCLVPWDNDLTGKDIGWIKTPGECESSPTLAITETFATPSLEKSIEFGKS
jgi:hypothetical protein